MKTLQAIADQRAALDRDEYVRLGAKMREAELAYRQAGEQAAGEVRAELAAERDRLRQACETMGGHVVKPEWEAESGTGWRASFAGGECLACGCAMPRPEGV